MNRNPEVVPTKTSKPEAGQEEVRAAASPRTREPAVAGTFYSGDPGVLRSNVDSLLAEAPVRDLVGLRALISPHAGYRYSGPIAAAGFKQLTGRHFERVVVMGPSHRVAFQGVAVPDADYMRTPLGVIRIADAAKQLTRVAPFVVDSKPHEHEHSVEVQLPFLQRTLGAFEVIPLVFGDVDNVGLASKLDELADARTLLLASSDLSHYYPYERAKAMDEATVQAILRLDLAGIRHGEACGMGPILTLMKLAQSRHWQARLLDLRNSGDTAGDRTRVVGYASIALVEP